MTRALVLAALLSLASCGALRWAFSPSSSGDPSPATKLATAAAENGSDPMKWIGWLVGAFGVGSAGGYAGGRYHGRERRSGRDRRGQRPELVETTPARAGD